MDLGYGDRKLEIWITEVLIRGALLSLKLLTAQTFGSVSAKFYSTAENYKEKNQRLLVASLKINKIKLKFKPAGPSFYTLPFMLVSMTGIHLCLQISTLAL